MKAETGQSTLPQTPFFMISLGVCYTVWSLPSFLSRQRGGWRGGRNSLFHSYPKGASPPCPHLETGVPGRRHRILCRNVW